MTLGRGAGQAEGQPAPRPKAGGSDGVLPGRLQSLWDAVCPRLSQPQVLGLQELAGPCEGNRTSGTGAHCPASRGPEEPRSGLGEAGAGQTHRDGAPHQEGRAGPSPARPRGAPCLQMSRGQRPTQRHPNLWGLWVLPDAFLAVGRTAGGWTL